MNKSNSINSFTIAILASSIIVIATFFIKYLDFSQYQLYFDFNYLDNKAVVCNTRKLLFNNKISEDNIDLWLNCVKKYNFKNKIQTQNTSKGWDTINLRNYNKIDFNENLNVWTEEEDSLDLNCRISAFILAKDMISSEFFAKNYNSDIEKEVSHMNTIFKGKITNKDETTFRSLFTPIELDIDSIKNVNLYDKSLKSLKNYWKKENLVFKSSNPSLIQVILIESMKNNNISVTTGHTGLLVKNNNDLYFIEKKNPYFPYQISKFKNYDDLNQYVFTQLEHTKNCKLMILENDNMIFRE